jgi:hypothetical protein
MVTHELLRPNNVTLQRYFGAIVGFTDRWDRRIPNTSLNSKFAYGGGSRSHNSLSLA